MDQWRKDLKMSADIYLGKIALDKRLNDLDEYLLAGLKFPKEIRESETYLKLKKEYKELSSFKKYSKYSVIVSIKED